MIRLIGQRNILGAGVHFSEFADQFRSLRLLGSVLEEVDFANPQALREAAERSTDRDLNIWFVQHPAIERFRGTHVQWAIFEADVLPIEYIDHLKRHARAVWVPSQWGRDVLIRCGLDPQCIDVVPEGVNPAGFHPFLRPRRAREAQPFHFLAVGKFEERKAYRPLLESFRTAFDNDPSVQLILKADYFIRADQARTELETLVAGLGLTNVKFAWGRFQPDQLLALYTDADAFVFPSRAEGWGLPLIEAIASGLPVIATVYSGHSEFLRPIRGLISPVEFDLEPIQDEEYLRYWPGLAARQARWAAPRVESMVQLLREEVQARSVRQAAALEASRVVRQRFTWRAAVDLAYERLLERGLYTASLRRA